MNTAVRFGFGENWQDFAAGVDSRRLEVAGQSLDRLLDKAPLDGRTFLDIGCGSGLFSLAAAKRGAIVKSFDFDANSVACTRNLRSVFFPHSESWTVEQGSILDRAYVDRLGTFDIVYSWGVLHHTGAMWTAVGNAAKLVAPGGTLAIALYRKTPMCRAWTWEKRLYTRSPKPVQAALRAAYKGALVASQLPRAAWPGTTTCTIGSEGIPTSQPWRRTSSND